MTKEHLLDRRAFLALAGASTLSAAATRVTPNGSNPLQSFLDNAVANGVPGITAVVEGNDGLRWSGTAGYADLERSRPITPRHVFGIGSITKVFVAVVILQLVEERRLRLDVTPAALLQDPAVSAVPNTDRATLDQLLNHTSGIPTWEFDPGWIRDARGAAFRVGHRWGKRETLAYVAGGRHPATNEPGRGYAYSNTNYTLLGLIIEHVTGNRAEREIRSRILRPLGLQLSYLDGFETARGQRAKPYHRATPAYIEAAGRNPLFRPVRPGTIEVSRSNLSPEWTAGGMMSTAQELVNFMRAIRDGRLLRPQSLAFMLDAIPTGNGDRMAGHGVARYGAFAGHNGAVLGYSGTTGWLADGSGAVMAALMNIGEMHSGEGFYSLRDLRPGLVDAARSLISSASAGNAL